MSKLTFVFRIAFLVFSYFGLTTLPGLAQGSQYANSVVPTPINTSDPLLAADQDDNTAAILQPGLVVANQAAVERVQFASVVPGNNKSGLTIKVNNLTNDAANDIIGASLLNKVTITAYLNGTSVGQWKLSTLLGLNVLTSGQKTSLTLSPAPTANFNQLEVMVEGTVNAYSVSYYAAFAPAPSPLPVTLVSFQGKATATGVQLSWQTASELRCSYFVVERASGSETGSFAAIGQVAGAGSSAQAHSYQFRDAEPTSLGYYRLRQVDTDGKSNYSPVVVVQAAPVLATLAAYPSPATETVQLTGTASAVVAIYDQQGRLLQQASVGQPLDVRGLPAGLYLVRDAATGSSTRFVKSL